MRSTLFIICAFSFLSACRKDEQPLDLSGTYTGTWEQTTWSFTEEHFVSLKEERDFIVSVSAGLLFFLDYSAPLAYFEDSTTYRAGSYADNYSIKFENGTVEYWRVKKNGGGYDNYYNFIGQLK